MWRCGGIGSIGTNIHYRKTLMSNRGYRPGPRSGLESPKSRTLYERFSEITGSCTKCTVLSHIWVKSARIWAKSLTKRLIIWYSITHLRHVVTLSYIFSSLCIDFSQSQLTYVAENLSIVDILPWLDPDYPNSVKALAQVTSPYYIICSCAL